MLTNIVKWNQKSAGNQPDCRCEILFWPPCQIDRGPSDTESMWPRLYYFIL